MWKSRPNKAFHPLLTYDHVFITAVVTSLRHSGLVLFLFVVIVVSSCSLVLFPGVSYCTRLRPPTHLSALCSMFMVSLFSWSAFSSASSSSRYGTTCLLLLKGWTQRDRQCSNTGTLQEAFPMFQHQGIDRVCEDVVLLVEHFPRVHESMGIRSSKSS